MCMLTEEEIRNWRENEMEKLYCLVDPVELRIHRTAVAVLDGVLND